MKKTCLAGMALTLIICVGVGILNSQKSATGVKSPKSLSLKEKLGKKLFFDDRLSCPEGQSCAACHGAEVGWTGPDEAVNRKGGVYPGAVNTRFGNRKPPASGYAGESPVLHIGKEGNFVGGLFWDGRATGQETGDPLTEQAMGPFLNPLEQNNPDKRSIIVKVRNSEYAGLFEKVWGIGSLDPSQADAVYERIARSIADFERSSDVNPFNSKFDAFWRKARAAGLKVEKINELGSAKFKNLGFDENELEGLSLFAGKGQCAACHSLEPVNGKPPVFTDFTYDNLGVPRNPQNPFYSMSKEHNPDGANWVDKGLGGFLEESEKYAPYAEANIGKHKVPTMRNVDRRPAPGMLKVFMHNGCFSSLKEVVRFYNTRDRAGAGWPPPEVRANMNTTEMGNLGLTEKEEDLIVRFMKTLSDT